MATDIKKFLAEKQAGGGDDVVPEQSGFDAEDLTCTIQTADGSVVLQTTLPARGFKPAKNKTTGKWGNSLGWQAMPRGDEAGSYCGLPVTGNIMLFLGVGKVPSGGDDFVLRPDSDDSDGSDEE